MKHRIFNIFLCVAAAFLLLSCEDESDYYRSEYLDRTPSRVTLEDYGETSFTISWGYVEDATSYTVQLVDLDEVPTEDTIYTTTSGSAYQFSGLTPNSKWYGRVRANFPLNNYSEWVYVTYDNSDERAVLVVGSGKVVLQQLDPPAPYFDQTAVYSNQLTLRWEANPDAASYNVRWWKDGDQSNATEVNTGRVYQIIEGLERNTTYYAQVMAVSDAGSEYDSEYSAAVSCTTSEEDAPDVARLETTLIHASSSTLTFEWGLIDEDIDETAKYNYNIALYTDEACTDLWVSWIISNSLYKPNLHTWVRFTFTDLDPGTDYWVRVNISDDDSYYSDPLKATTTTFDYTVSSNSTAQVGDILVAEDFHKLIHGGDMAFKAIGISVTNTSNRSSYEHSRGENPTSYASPVNFTTEFNVVTGGGVTSTYTEALGLGDWCIGSGTNVSTRAGYPKLGGGSGALGYLATPELSAIPSGSTATVTVQCDILSYNEDTASGDYGHWLQICAIDNVVVSNYQVAEWTTTSDSASPVDAEVIFIEDAKGGDNADHEFFPFTATLSGVTRTCRIRFSSDPSYYSGGSRFFLDNVVITVTDIK